LFPAFSWRGGAPKARPRSGRCCCGSGDPDRHAGRAARTESEYFIFTDPLIILASAILLDRLSDLRFRQATCAIALILFGLHVAIGKAEPVKYALIRRGPRAIREWNPYYTPRLALPWCSPIQPSLLIANRRPAGFRYRGVIET